jgi:kynurenine formamidase
MIAMKRAIICLLVVWLCYACREKNSPEPVFKTPIEIIDLGDLVTEDLPYRNFGVDVMKSLGFEKSNHSEVIRWTIGELSGSNSYYTFFNHGGAHVDAPRHVDFEGGIDSYPVEKFVGPLKVFDVSNYPNGRSIPADIFQGKVSAGDIVMIYTNWKPPLSLKTEPSHITLSYKAAEYLAELPVRAFCTDTFGADCFGGTDDPVANDSPVAQGAPIHYSFLSRGIPIFEQLVNVDKLISKKDMLFVGAPLNIKGGDGFLVRPVVLVY